MSSIVKLNRRLEQIDELAARIKEASNEFGENLAERVLDAAERGAGWKEDMDELHDPKQLKAKESPAYLPKSPLPSVLHPAAQALQSVPVVQGPQPGEGPQQAAVAEGLTGGFFYRRSSWERILSENGAPGSPRPTDSL